MQVLIITLILFLMTSSMAAIREEPSLIGVEKKISSGLNLPQPSPKHFHVIRVEEKNIKRSSWNDEDYDSPHSRKPLHNFPQPSPQDLSFD
ncbi:hypothetical protein CARUB_v10021632mg [Capsella rubella]|uniref:Uncharacterized protein n=1 Tax=Capsella rubella TaxID=81985 RepID=R0GER8_9BRAS|nr:hypothetical protein CARUB_v10021632mg [Capsella rubella]